MLDMKILEKTMTQLYFFDRNRHQRRKNPPKLVANAAFFQRNGCEVGCPSVEHGLCTACSSPEHCTEVQCYWDLLLVWIRMMNDVLLCLVWIIFVVNRFGVWMMFWFGRVFIETFLIWMKFLGAQTFRRNMRDG